MRKAIIFSLLALCSCEKSAERNENASKALWPPTSVTQDLCSKMVGSWSNNSHSFSISEQSSGLVARMDDGGVIAGKCSEGIFSASAAGNLTYIEASDQIAFIGMTFSRNGG